MYYSKANEQKLKEKVQKERTKQFVINVCIDENKWHFPIVIFIVALFP